MEKKIQCKKCNSGNTFVIFEHEHNCLRGYCKECRASWKES